MYKNTVVFCLIFFSMQLAFGASSEEHADCKKEDYSLKAHNRRIAARKAADKKLQKLCINRYRSIDRSGKPDSQLFNRLSYFEEKKGYAPITPEAEIIDRVKNYEGIENLKLIDALFKIHKVNPDIRDACGVPLLVGQSYTLTDMLLSYGANPTLDNDLALKKARSRSVAELLIKAKTKN